MNKAAKAESTIRAAAKAYGCTQHGIEWIDHALDPFKDMLKPCAGYPDRNSNPSIVEVVKSSVNIVAPGVVNWDCNIFLDQTLQGIVHYLTTAIGPAGNPSLFQLSGQGATPYFRGGVCYRTDTSGNPLYISTTKGTVDIPTNLYTNEDCRLISVGIEVHDVT